MRKIQGALRYVNMKTIIIYIASILVSFAAGAVGSLATIPNIPTWYEHLTKPPLLPPNWVFGPVWTLLYLLMGIALALLITNRSSNKTVAYLWFGAQLILNTAWSIVFFGLHLPWLAAVIIIALIGAIIITMIKFRHFVPITVWFFAPYLAWVCFATYLNLGVALLN